MKILTTDFTDATDKPFPIRSHPRHPLLGIQFCLLGAMALLAGCGGASEEGRARAALPAAKKYMLTKMLSPASTVFVEAPLRPTRDTEGGCWINMVNANGAWLGRSHSNPTGTFDNPGFAPCLIVSSNGAPGAANLALLDYNYTVAVKNIGHVPAVRNLELQLNDSNGSQVDSDYRSAIGVPAGETVVFTGSVRVSRSEIGRIAQVVPKLTKAE